jgi:hypothetical protein
MILEKSKNKILSPFMKWLIISAIAFCSSCAKENSCENCNGNEAKPPVAKAGIDQIIYLPVDSVALDGSASTDTDGTINSFEWIKISGPLSFNIVSPFTSKTIIKNLVPGIYDIELKVTDNNGLVGRDTTRINVITSTVSSGCDPSARPLVNATISPETTIPGGSYTTTVGNKMFFLVIDCNNHCEDTTNSPAYFNIYDINSQTWSASSVHAMKTRFSFTICTGSNRIFMAGGYNTDGDTYRRAVTDVDIYNIASNTWSVTNLNGGKYGMAGAVLNNNVYLAGGYYENDQNHYYASDKVEIYNVNNNTWSNHLLNEARTALSATIAGEKIFFAGGINALNDVVKTIDVFNSSTSSWSVSNLLEPKASSSPVVAGNNIYWAGGTFEKRTEPTGFSFVPTRHVEIKDFNTGNAVIHCLFQPNAVVGAQKNNQIVFLAQDTYYSVKNKFDIFNLITNTWSIGLLPVDFVTNALISVNNSLFVPAPVINGVGSNQIWRLDL